MTVDDQGSADEEPKFQYRKAYFCCTIAELWDIEASQLYIDWNCEIPRGWHLDQSTTPFTSGSTQRSVPTYDSHVGKYKCNFGFMVNLNFDKVPLQPIAGDVSSEAVPRLHFQVRSVDAYQRFCFEGYAELQLSQCVSGHYERLLYMWRPSSADSRVTEMRRFFLGNGPELLSPAVPVTQSSGWNKFGQDTEPAGQLRIVVDSVWEKGYDHWSALRQRRILGKVVDGFSAARVKKASDEHQHEVQRALERAKSRLSEMQQQKPEDDDDATALSQPADTIATA